VAGRGEHGIDAVAVAALQIIAPMQCSALVWPMTGSTAARRFISRRIGLVTRRAWPLIQTRYFSV